MDQMIKKYPGGVWPVMLTPYTSKNKIDEYALEKLTDWYVENGVNGLFAACQSSEIFSLSLEERLKIVEITLKTVNRRIPVIASANTSYDLKKQAEELCAVWDLGVDAVIILSNRFAEEGESSNIWIENMQKLLELLPKDMRLGMYECPYPYKRVISHDELQAMLDTNRYYFIKDTCCDIERIKKRLNQIKGSHLQLFNANTTTLLESLHHGADGYCGVMANFHPEMYVWLCNHYLDHRAKEISDILSINSLIERQLYPVNAKWHLKEIKGLPIEIFSRVQCCKDLSETFKEEVRAMDRIIKKYYQLL